MTAIEIMGAIGAVCLDARNKKTSAHVYMRAVSSHSAKGLKPMLIHSRIKGKLITQLINALDSADMADFDVAAANIAAQFVDCETPIVGVALSIPQQLTNAAILLRNTWGISLGTTRAKQGARHVFICAELMPTTPQLDAAEAKRELTYA